MPLLYIKANYAPRYSPMQRTIPVVAFVVFAWFVSGTGCEADQCTKMRDCCAAISEEPWVGGACGAIAADVRNPDSCRSVLDAISIAAEDNKHPLPPVCQ